MSRIIKPLNPSHMDAYIEIAFNAYPSFKDFSPEGKASYKAEALEIMAKDPIVTFFGMFEEETLIAVMRIFDFQMNCFGKVIPVTGLGFLGVHLLYKKQGIAKAMVDFYEDYTRSKQRAIGLLLPFRPDFYKRMGYGLGTKLNQYRLRPDQLPYKDSNLRSTYRLKYLEAGDLEALLSCHNRAVGTTHGMIQKFGDEIRPLFGDAFNHIVGVYKNTSASVSGSSDAFIPADAPLVGYMVYQFKNGKAGNYTITDLIVKEWVFENADCHQVLLNFLYTQKDQIRLVVINTEDQDFYHLIDNPLNDTHNYIPYGYLETNTQAIGAMYKLVDLKGAFLACQHRNYNGESLRLHLSIKDNYKGLPLETLVITFEGGQVTRCTPSDAEWDVAIEMTIADFSVLFLGIAGFKALYHLGLIAINPHQMPLATALDQLDRLFYTWQKPVCYTDF